MMNKSKQITLTAICLLLASLLSGCYDKPAYSNYAAVQPMGWSADSTINFTLNINDTTPAYRMLLQVRHDDNYPYQNMWVFVDVTDPSRHTKTDTIEFFLADQRGKWLGGGAGSLKLMPVIISDDRKFCHAGEYRISVRHGMRVDKLKGIHDIGIELYVKK